MRKFWFDILRRRKGWNTAVFCVQWDYIICHHNIRILHIIFWLQESPLLFKPVSFDIPRSWYLELFCVFPATSTRQDRIISWRKTTWYVCEKIWYLYLLCNNTLHEMLIKTGILCPFLTFVYVLLYCISPCLFHHLVPPLLSFSCLGLCFFHYLSFCIASFIRSGSKAAATSKICSE